MTPIFYRGGRKKERDPEDKIGGRRERGRKRREERRKKEREMPSILNIKFSNQKSSRGGGNQH